MFINLATNEEQRLSALNKYVKKHCQTLHLSDPIALSIIDLLVVIFKFDTSKRAKMKDGLFIICLYWVLKTKNIYRSIDELRIKLNVDQKYISKGQSLFMEIVQKQKDKIPFFNTVHKIMMEKDIIIDFLDKFSFVLQSEFNLNLADIKKIESFIRKFEEYCNSKGNKGVKSQNGSNFVYTPNSIILGCIYFYICTISSNRDTDEILNNIVGRFGSSKTSIKRICKEIEKAILNSSY